MPEVADVVYHNPDVVHTYYLLIPTEDLTEYKILLKEMENDFWALPSFEPYEHHFAVVQHINDYLRATLGLSAATLRCIATRNDAERGEQRFYAIDNLHPDWQCPDGYQFFEEEEIAKLSIQTRLQRDTLLSWFDWRHSDHSQRVSWMRSGWFPQVASWMIDLADRMSMRDIHLPEQRRIWSRSATVRLKTANETLYLKAVPQFFNYEPVITRVLSIRYPQHTPDVRAVHVENGWMLMRDFGGKPLSMITDIAIWKQALRDYAKIQIDMLKNTQSLIALGVPDRNIDYMASQIERLMHDLPDTLTHEEQRDLKRISGSLRRLCFEIVEFNVPLTLTHGDFWSGNTIIKDDGNSLFFDWSDASISHPFFDVTMFLSEIESELPDIPDAHGQLLNAYLDSWTRFEPLGNLKYIYSIAQVLSSLHQVLFYYVHILPRVESAVRWELSGMLTNLLRQVLEAQKNFEELD